MSAAEKLKKQKKKMNILTCPPWIAVTLGSAVVSCTKQESLDIQSWCFRKEHPLPPYVIQHVCPQGQLLQGCVTIFPGHRRGYSPISEGSQDVHSFSASWAGPGVRGFEKCSLVFFFLPVFKQLERTVGSLNSPQALSDGNSIVPG